MVSHIKKVGILHRGAPDCDIDIEKLDHPPAVKLGVFHESSAPIKKSATIDKLNSQCRDKKDRDNHRGKQKSYDSSESIL